MNTPPKTKVARTAATGKAAAPRLGGGARQPAATGANRGSPAAAVMKQFAKTKAESTGGS